MFFASSFLASVNGDNISIVSVVESSYLLNPCPICTAPVILMLFFSSAKVAPKF